MASAVLREDDIAGISVETGHHEDAAAALRKSKSSPQGSAVGEKKVAHVAFNKNESPEVKFFFFQSQGVFFWEKKKKTPCVAARRESGRGSGRGSGARGAPRSCAGARCGGV